MMTHRFSQPGFFGLSVVLCTSIAGCPKQDARLEPLETKTELPCSSDADCEDSNPCSMNSCDSTTHHCVIMPLDGVGTPMAPQATCLEHVCEMGVDLEIPVAAGTAISNQVAGDCRKWVCDGTGNEIEVDDNSDVNIDDLECTLDVCSGGNPTNPNAPKDSPCGANLACDGNGHCIGCVDATQCSGGATSCTVGVCNAGVCQLEPVPDETPLPLQAQTVGDCVTRICDGTGHPYDMPADDPEDDSNECTSDICNGTTPVHVPVSAGTACMGDSACDGAGQCLKPIGGSCAANDECASGFCAEGVCCDGACTIDCQACNLPGSNGLGTNTPFYQQDGACADTNVCDGNGACKIANGETCTNGASNCVSGTCKSTLCKGLPGQPCSANKDCSSNNCNNGVCQ